MVMGTIEAPLLTEDGMPLGAPALAELVNEVVRDAPVEREPTSPVGV